MQYLALIYSDPTVDAKRTDEENAAYIGAYQVFTEHSKAVGAYRAGEALMPAQTAKSVRVRDGERLVTDGPFAETREVLGGFYMLECETEEEAIELASRIPTAAHGTIEVRPIMTWDD